MRISDWSSDVCSSDLARAVAGCSTAGDRRYKEFRMCSILGAFDLRPGADLAPLRPLALSLSARQRHRGPDWRGVPASRRALLVHVRLAIVDPAGRAQSTRPGPGERADRQG